MCERLSMHTSSFIYPADDSWWRDSSGSPSLYIYTQGCSQYLGFTQSSSIRKGSNTSWAQVSPHWETQRWRQPASFPFPWRGGSTWYKQTGDKGAAKTVDLPGLEAETAMSSAVRNWIVNRMQNECTKGNKMRNCLLDTYEDTDMSSHSSPLSPSLRKKKVELNYRNKW